MQLAGGFDMFKSKKGICMKSNEELQSYIICLRKQLAISLNENRILRIKMNRLENELQKKDTHIQNLVASHKARYFAKLKKDFDIKKLVKQHGKGLILNIQKQIHILEEKLLQNEMSNNNKVKSQKNSDRKIIKRKESKMSVQSISSKGTTSQHSVDQQKDKKFMKSKKQDSRSKNDVSESDEDKEDWQIDDSCLNILKMLKEQTNTEKYDNKSKNNQISYLLNKIKSFKKATSEACAFSQKSESGILSERSIHSSSTLNPENSNKSFNLRNERNFHNPVSQFESTECTREQNENNFLFQSNSKHTNLDSNSDISSKPIKQRTTIEYISDSEVSTDEDYSWQSNNIRNNRDEHFVYH